MFPISLDIADWPVMVVGNTPAAARRLALLDEAGAGRVTAFADEAGAEMRAQAGERLIERLPQQSEVAAVRVLFTADLNEESAARFAAWAREARVFVNTEDVRALCDFHVPAMVRRGDLLLTISTNGKSPGLARRLRRDFETRYGPEWGERLDALSAQRDAWRAEGVPLKELARRTDDFLAEKGWLL